MHERHPTTRALAASLALLSSCCLAEPRPFADPQLEQDQLARSVKADAPPRRLRRLLIFDLNVGYGGHASIRTANEAITHLGQTTRAYETEIHRDPAVFARETLARFDAVCLNNTVGNLFTNSELRCSLAEFVAAGGGLIGVHGTSVAFTHWPGAREDWPEFALMLGARGASHRAPDERLVLRVEEPDHPLVAAFPSPSFEHVDEFFRFGPPWSRARCRVLLSVDLSASARLPGNETLPAFRSHGDYAIAWIRRHGRGRILYTALGHHPQLFADPVWLRFLLAGIQYALGDRPAPDLPTARCSPARAAQYALGWHLALASDQPEQVSVRRLCQAAAALSLGGVAVSIGQPLDDDGAVRVSPHLPPEHLAAIRIAVAEAGLRPIALFSDGIAAHSAIDLARRLGATVVISDSASASSVSPPLSAPAERDPIYALRLRWPTHVRGGSLGDTVALEIRQPLGADPPRRSGEAVAALCLPADELAPSARFEGPPPWWGPLLASYVHTAGDDMPLIVAGTITADGGVSASARQVISWLDHIAMDLAGTAARSPE